MRKSLGLVIVLLLFGSVSAIWCARMIYAERDQVQFTETVLAGDPAVADGLSIRAHATYNNQLFWNSNTVFNKDKPLTTHTEYHFFNTEQKEEYVDSYHGVELYSNFESSGAYAMDMSNQIEPVGIDRAYQELYNIVQPGQELEKTFTVADYYDYYPLSGIIDLQGIREDFGIWRSYDPTYDQSIPNKFAEFFQIPVLSTEQITILLGKNSDGSTYTGSSAGDGEQFYLQTQSIVTPTTCYFSFNNRTNMGNIVDTSLIPGGYGIYAIDYTPGTVKLLANGGTQILTNGSIQLDSLRMVFPIDPHEEFLHLSQWADDKTILLYTRLEHTYYLTVISMDTMQQIQRLSIQTAESDNYNIIQNQDFIVALTDKTITVLLPNSDGTFYTDMQTKNSLDYSYIPWSIDAYAIDYQDGKLAFAYEGYNQESGIHDSIEYEMVVLDECGLQFWAKYQSSLQNIQTDNDSSSKLVRLIFNHPLEVSWQ